MTVYNLYAACYTVYKLNNMIKKGKFIVKKATALFMALVFIISLAACSKNNNSDGGASKSDQGVTSESKESNSVAEEKVKISRGVVANGVYTNDSMGITIAPGDGWTFLSDDEMATLYGISSDLFTEDAAAKLENSSIVYDMYCHNDEGSSISVNFENINLFAGLILDEKSYLEFSSGNISEQFDETSGIRIVKNEMGEIEIDGKTVPCLYVSLRYEEQGIDIYEALAAQKRGSFFGVVTVSTLSENSLAETAKKITLE